jgi:hypothetical protein
MKLVSVNRRPNFHRLDMGSLTVWFSYETPIAFQRDGCKIVVRKNEWKTTTGRHLNELQPDHKLRVEGIKFLAMLEGVI